MNVVELSKKLMKLPPEKHVEVMAKAKLKREQDKTQGKVEPLAGAGIQGGIHE